jgi:hypothetical protein
MLDESKSGIESVWFIYMADNSAPYPCRQDKKIFLLSENAYSYSLLKKQWLNMSLPWILFVYYRYFSGQADTDSTILQGKNTTHHL